MVSTDTAKRLKIKGNTIRPQLNERQLRVVALAESNSLGHGGTKAVANACGINRRTIERAAKEPTHLPGENRICKLVGAGRKKLTEKMPGLLQALENLVESTTRGDPMCALRWTSKSTQKLAAELTEQGFSVSAQTVARLLIKSG